MKLLISYFPSKEFFQKVLEEKNNYGKAARFGAKGDELKELLKDPQCWEKCRCSQKEGNESYSNPKDTNDGKSAAAAAATYTAQRKNEEAMGSESDVISLLKKQLEEAKKELVQLKEQLVQKDKLIQYLQRTQTQ